MKRIFCFVNSGKGTDWQEVMALDEDGRVLAQHISSHAAWAQYDIGVTSDSKHEAYKTHHPDGYELVWVEDPGKHEGVLAAYAKNQARKAKDADIRAHPGFKAMTEDAEYVASHVLSGHSAECLAHHDASVSGTPHSGDPYECKKCGWPPADQQASGGGFIGQ